jgi:sugar transferase (PEP-CTERM/EpsH1 system associated)
MAIPILHLITELSAGGAQTALLRLLTGLDRDRFSPTVACLYNGDGTVAQRIRALGIRVFDAHMHRKVDLAALLRLYRWIRYVHPMILHTYLFHANLPGRILGRLAGVPIIVCSERTMETESEWRYRLNRITDPLTDRVVCVSQHVADFVVEHVGIPRHKTLVIPNGVALQDFEHLPSKQRARAALGLSPHQMLIGTVARLESVKRLDVLLQAVESLHDVYAVIVGDGPEQAQLKAMSERSGLAARVHFAGQQDDVRTWLAAMDVFVLSSDWEGLSNAMLEAMAAGLPIVATAVGGTPMGVVDGITGLLVPPRDPVALAEAIACLLRDPNLRHQMGQAGRERVAAQFDIATTVRCTEALYQRLLQEKLGLQSTVRKE